MRKLHIFTFAIIVFSFLVSIYFYPHLPQWIVTHWGIDGQADGYMAKPVGLFIFPIVLTLLYFLFLYLPQIDPLKRNLQKFRSYFDVFMLLVTLFLFYVYLLTLFWNIGIEFNMIQLLSPAFAILFYYAGILINHAKRNYFVGIKTPWTLSSDVVWNKTHRLGSKLFKVVGIIALLGIFVPRLAIYVILIPVLLTAVIVTVYSYVAYQDELKHKKAKPRTKVQRRKRRS